MRIISIQYIHSYSYLFLLITTSYLDWIGFVESVGFEGDIVPGGIDPSIEIDSFVIGAKVI